MNITFINVKSNKIKKLISEAATFYANKLMEKTLINQLYIEIHLSKRFKDVGQCVHEDEHDVKNPKFFKIEIRNKVDDPNILITLAHEMVHLKQFATGELDISMPLTSLVSAMIHNTKITPKWKGKIFKLKDYEDDYWDLPWEIEAYGRQQSLWERFLDFKDSIGEKDYIMENI